MAQIADAPDPRSARPPPRTEVGMMGWLRHNLFASPLDCVLTLIALFLIYWALTSLVGWAIVRAVWSGADGAACNADNAGACWPFIKAKFGLFLYGRYPDAQRWRIDLTYILAAGGLVAVLAPRVPHKGWSALYTFIAFPILAYWLLTGGLPGLPIVQTDLWGGLLITLVVASVGIVASFPIGVALALGRRSEMPVIRVLCIGFIETVRGVPLISVLFMASVMLKLFLPPGMDIDKLLRALIGVTLFSAAYLAETVRGGLQAIPRGQLEAADALGLSYAQKMRLIVLPQALKLVIPGIVNSFVALFKDTSLVLVIGLFDLLGIVQQSVQGDPKWASPSTAATGYIFAGALFWVFCFAMSRYSARLEARLDTVNR